jgi:hypothetical protein
MLTHALGNRGGRGSCLGERQEAPLGSGQHFAGTRLPLMSDLLSFQVPVCSRQKRQERENTSLYKC